ncbi:MAG: hypothetical protein SGARI_004609, partial [Bacillariaceae sp.]
MSCDNSLNNKIRGKPKESVAENPEGDRRMDAEDYVTFVQLYGPDGFLEDIDAFADLPLILQSNFNILACLCQQNSADECCVGDNAGIETDGAFDGETPTGAEASYLYLVCSLTQVTIDRVLQSSAPSASPTSTPYPSEAPTDTPAPTITPSPTMDLTTEIEVLVPYEIGVKAGNSSDDCVDGLIGAMDSLAPQVLAEVRRRLLKDRKLRRRLRSVQLGTSIESIADIECPDGVDEDDSCEQVTASITLLFQPTEEDPEAVAKQFQEDLEEAIYAGELQEFLNCTSVYILDESVLGTPAPSSEDRGISAGGVAGVVIVSLAAVAIVGVLVARTGVQDKEELEELEPAPRDLKIDDGGDEGGDGGEIKASSAVVKASGTLAAAKK